MAFFHRFKSLLALFALSLTLTLVATDFADARRGGSFGSRGTRTWVSPRTTTTAPTEVAPVQRTMTPRPDANQTGAVRQNTTTASRPGFFNGFGGSLLGGLLVGGLIGMMLGHGIGGGFGLLGLILQAGLLLLAFSFLMRLLRSRREPALAGAGQGYASNRGAYGLDPAPSAARAGAGTGPSYGAQPDEIGLTAADFDGFERMLSEVQDAYAREDYAALRSRTTPEVMGYLSEELAGNATRGLRNEVSGTRLLQGDLAEAWRENGMEYATVAMRYESIDVTRDRATGRVVEGDPERPTEATELWTFVRRGPGDEWKLSAIQES